MMSQLYIFVVIKDIPNLAYFIANAYDTWDSSHKIIAEDRSFIGVPTAEHQELINFVCTDEGRNGWRAPWDQDEVLIFPNVDALYMSAIKIPLGPLYTQIAAWKWDIITKGARYGTFYHYSFAPSASVSAADTGKRPATKSELRDAIKDYLVAYVTETYAAKLKHPDDTLLNTLTKSKFAYTGSEEVATIY